MVITFYHAPVKVLLPPRRHPCERGKLRQLLLVLWGHPQLHRPGRRLVHDRDGLSVRRGEVQALRNRAQRLRRAQPGDVEVIVVVDLVEEAVLRAEVRVDLAGAVLRADQIQSAHVVVHGEAGVAVVPQRAVQVGHLLPQAPLARV
eukprot:CAMPEP_0118946248 /NCGR_PEP_ID=MMETSP1169-20130426/43886_1 /TAXON_ID=36882 /ORGANISM="Pyramimonas obovata, Strain CCMP722" /LENGTH=145 /DNA_ID=CAMNT_0006892175 /DNA_START=31 /DNA_END=464 /DNA_ORIENTATION=-